MSNSVVAATELKFDFSTLTAADFPRLSGQSAGSSLVVLPWIVTQCPWGDPSKLETWKRLPFRTLAGVMRALQAESTAQRADLTGWTFDMQKLTPEDLDFINAAALRGQTPDGARMIAKYAAGIPVGVLEATRASLQQRFAGKEVPLPSGPTLTASDVLELNYYAVYMPLLLRLQKEAQEEFQAGFLHALVSAPVVSG